MKFTVETHPDFSVLTFAFEGSLEPNCLTDLDVCLPSLPLDKGVVISGRGPVWLFCTIAHHYHPAKWVATHDPRLGGGIVVATHTPGVGEGEIIKF